MSDQAARDTADLERFGYKQELNRGLGTFSSFAVAFSYISPSTGHLHVVRRRDGCPGCRPVLDVAGRGADAVHRRAEFRGALQPLPGSRIRVPVDEVPLRADLRMVHRLVLSGRGHPHGRLGLRDAPDRAATDAEHDARHELQYEPRKRGSGGRRGHHTRPHHDPQHLRRPARRDRQQHGRRVRDPRHGRLRHHPGHRVRQPRRRRDLRLGCDGEHLRVPGAPSASRSSWSGCS